MAQGLRVCVAPEEAMNLLHGTYIWQFTTAWNSSYRGSDALASTGTCTPCTYPHTYIELKINLSKGTSQAKIKGNKI